MSRFLTLLLLMLTLADCGATKVPPLWERESKDVAYFRSIGFEFSADRSMARHSSKAVAEITITFPNNFSYEDQRRDFESVSILSEDISTGIETYDEAGKKRILLTVSDEFLRRSQLAFYYLGPTERATRGAMYLLELSSFRTDKKAATSSNGKKQLLCASPTRAEYDRNLFNTGALVMGTQPEKAYDPSLLGRLYTKRQALQNTILTFEKQCREMNAGIADLKRQSSENKVRISALEKQSRKMGTEIFQLGRKIREIELKMFDLINEAAFLRDRRIQAQLDVYGDSLGYIPSLAVRHYKYVSGDTSQLDWLLAEDAKAGFGRDSLILTVFGYIDEWDKTIRRFQQHDEVADGAAGEVFHAAMRIRKQIYGAERFDAAWNRIQ